MQEEGNEGGYEGAIWQKILNQSVIFLIIFWMACLLK